MAIWIDNHYHEESCDDVKLYEYLYHLLQMIAYQHGYFKSADQYDDYALQGASKLFLRLKDKRQFGDQPVLKPIKSILNYIKTISYPYKVDFEQTSYVETSQETLILHSDTASLSNYIAEESDIFDKIDFQQSLDSTDSIIKDYLKKIPYRKNTAEFKNIYISCILTLLNSITVTAEHLNKINNQLNILDSTLTRLYRKSKYDDPILYHLPNYMSNYIKVLVREIEHAIAKELSTVTNSYISSETSIKNLIASTLEDEAWA